MASSKSQPGLKVAVKSFRLDNLEKNKLEELENEVQNYLSMDHPQITSLYDVYESKRELLTPRDAAAAFFTMGKLARHAAYRVGGDPLDQHKRAIELRRDVVACAPHMPSMELMNSLLGAAFLRTSDEALLSALCAAASEKALEHFNLREVSSCVYALGRLGRPDEQLLPKLLSRVTSEAPYLHAIEMANIASGLADLNLAPPSALEAISKVSSSLPA